jgi:hypothetical protein
MKQLFFLTLIVILFVTCKKDQQICCLYPKPDERIDIHYMDHNGFSLINSAAEFSDSNIIIFYKKDGFFVNAFDPNIDYPEKFVVFKNDGGETILRVNPSHFYFDGTFSETMIELNPKTRDILRCEFTLNDWGRTCKNVWFNGEKKDSTFFEVIK